MAAEATNELEGLVAALTDPTKIEETTTNLNSYIIKIKSEVEKTPNSELYILLGRAHFYLEQDPEAIIALDKALNVDQNNAAAHFWRGLIARYNKDTETSVLHLEKATELAPTNVKYWYELGVVYAGDLQNTNKGAKAFQECIKNDPKHAQAYYQLGSIEATNLRNEAAVELFKKAIECDPNYVHAHYNLGQIYQITKDYEKGIECFSKVTELAPNDWQARSKLIQLNYALNREAEALQHRDILFQKWQQGIIQAPRFCREQIEIADYRVIIYEYFALGTAGLKYDCQVIKDDQVQYRFSCGSYDMTNAIYLAMNPDSPRLYHFDGYYPGGLHKTFAMRPGEPTYQEMRAKLVEVVSGTAEPLSSSVAGGGGAVTHA